MIKRKRAYSTPKLTGPRQAPETGDIGDFDGDLPASPAPQDPPTRLSIPSRTRSLPVSATLIYRDPEILGGSTLPTIPQTQRVNVPLAQDAAFNVKPDSALRNRMVTTRAKDGSSTVKEVRLPNPLAPADAQIERAVQAARRILSAKAKATDNDRYALLRKRNDSTKTEDDN